MLPQNKPDRIRILFDDHRLVANAGLNRPMKGLERHTRQRVRRLKAVASIVHSAATLTRPRSRNLRAPCCSLMIPKTGSTSCFLSLYASLAAEVDIQPR